MECFHIVGMSASHHYIVVFIEFNSSCRFGEGVTKVVVCGDVRIGDLFFFGPLENEKVFHINVSCALCWLLCIRELSCTSVIGEDFSW